MGLAMVTMNPMATNVLMVEDNVADRNLVRLSLSGSPHSYKLDCAGRLSEGLEKLERRQTDAVLLDLNLPDSQGNETIKRVMKHAPEVPILVLTGSDDDSMALEAMRMGAQDYIVKGQHDGHALSRALLYAIGRHQVLMSSRQAGQKSPVAKEEGAVQDYPKLRLSLARVPDHADVAPRGFAGSLIDKENGLKLGKCVMKSRHGYEGFVIEARVHERTDGEFSVEFSVEEHDGHGVTERQFYLPSCFLEQDSAMESAVRAGRQRIDEGLWARPGNLRNS